MLATNHGLAGMIIGATIPIPIAIPAAFASHFVLDVIPHYGPRKSRRNSSKTYKKIVYIDTTVALSGAFFTGITGRWDMFWIGWIAYGPDAYWVYLHFKQKGTMNLRVKNRFAKFHQNIQSEHKWGLLIELPVAGAMFVCFVNLL